MSEHDDQAEDSELGLLADTTAGPPARDLGTEVGIEVRRLRRMQDMTVSELAKSAGMSQGMLSRIENGQTMPSLTTLNNLAEALNVPISSFFSGMERSTDVSFVPANQGLLIDRRGTRRGHLYQLLGYGVNSAPRMEPYLITLTEESEAYGEFRHEGVELIYMQTGRLIYRHGDQTYPLGPGDSLFFDAIAPHGPVELVELPCTYLSVIAYPKKNP
ncbi:MAG: XRE family transcriptional regulator [Alphaproteobacteria bacterium]